MKSCAARQLRGPDDRLQRRCRVGDGDVLAHAAVEQDVVLRHHADLPAQLRGIDQADVQAVHQHAPALGAVQARCTSLVSVLLPEPERPTMPITSPGWMSRSMPLSTGGASGR